MRPCFSLSCDEAPQVRELAVVEVRFAEPALDAGRDGPRLLGGAVGGGQGLGPRGELLEGLATDRLARLDDDDGRLRARGDRLGQGAEQVGSTASPDVGAADAPMTTRSACSASREDGVPDVRRPRAGRSRARPLTCCLTNAGQRALGLGPDGHRDPGRHEVQDDDASRRGARAIASANRIASSACGPPRTGTRIRLMSAAPRCLTTAMSHGDSRTTSSIVGEKTARPAPSRPLGVLPPQPKMMRSASCSAAASTMPSAA